MLVCEHKGVCGVCPLSSFTTLCLFHLTEAPSLNLGHFYLLGGKPECSVILLSLTP